MKYFHYFLTKLLFRRQNFGRVQGGVWRRLYRRTRDPYGRVLANGFIFNSVVRRGREPLIENQAITVGPILQHSSSLYTLESRRSLHSLWRGRVRSRYTDTQTHSIPGTCCRPRSARYLHHHLCLYCPGKLYRQCRGCIKMFNPRSFFNRSKNTTGISMCRYV